MEDTLRSLDFDLTHIGINVTETFERLLSPAGVLNQYALSIILQSMTIIGFITAGLTFQYYKSITTSGPLLGILAYFETHLSPQAIFTTIARRLITLVWELLARTMTTFMLYGISNAVSEIISSTSPLSVWEFVSSSALGEIMTWRLIFTTLSIGLQYPALSAAGPAVSQALQGLSSDR